MQRVSPLPLFLPSSGHILDQSVFIIRMDKTVQYHTLTITSRRMDIIQYMCIGIIIYALQTGLITMGEDEGMGGVGGEDAGDGGGDVDI